MLDAFEQVWRARDGDVRLCVVGDGPLRGHYTRRLSPEPARAVQFAGRLDWNRPRYYASADVLCSPCLKASFGMVLLEAMSCALPIVASRISGFELLSQHGREGLLVGRPDDPSSFADGIARLLDAPAERKRMGAEGRHTAVSRMPGTGSRASSRPSTRAARRRPATARWSGKGGDDDDLGGERRRACRRSARRTRDHLAPHRLAILVREPVDQGRSGATTSWKCCQSCSGGPGHGSGTVSALVLDLAESRLLELAGEAARCGEPQRAGHAGRGRRQLDARAERPHTVAKNAFFAGSPQTRNAMRPSGRSTRRHSAERALHVGEEHDAEPGCHPVEARVLEGQRVGVGDLEARSCRCPRSSAASSMIESQSLLRSVAVTRPSLPSRRASVSAGSPAPLARSSTRRPGSISAAASSASVSDLVCIAKGSRQRPQAAIVSRSVQSRRTRSLSWATLGRSGLHGDLLLSGLEARSVRSSETCGARSAPSVAGAEHAGALGGEAHDDALADREVARRALGTFAISSLPFSAAILSRVTAPRKLCAVTSPASAPSGALPLSCSSLIDSGRSSSSTSARPPAGAPRRPARSHAVDVDRARRGDRLSRRFIVPMNSATKRVDGAP